MKYEGLKRVEVELCQSQCVRTVVVSEEQEDYIVIESNISSEAEQIKKPVQSGGSLLYTLFMQVAVAIMILCSCFLLRAVDHAQAEQAVSYIKTAITYDLFDEYRAEDYEPASSDFLEKIIEFFK